MVLVKEKNLELNIEKFALANAFQFNGKANLGSVLGKILAERPHLKLHIKELTPLIQKIVGQVNKLKTKDQEKKLREIYPAFFAPKEKPKEKILPPLPNAVKDKVVMRFAPSPSGPLHIGHAYVMGLNSEYCRMYNGKFILRIEDTNPENIAVDAYKFIPEDANWATKGNVAQVIVQSDRMKIYYKWAEEVLKRGRAYVCVCNPEKWKALMIKGHACPCRGLEVKEQLERWAGMLDGTIPEGSAVVRIKTDLTDKNPAMRDWPALRINETKHPRVGKKFRVWPLMNFAVAVDDYEMGITHSVRGKDHADNERRQNILQKKMGWPSPIGIHVGRINFVGFELSTTKTRKKIEEGKYTGWDDARIPFLRAFKRRGYTPEALARFAIEIGPSLTDKTVSVEDFFKNLNAYNREVLDPIANRYWFVPNPVKLEVKDAPSIKEAEAKLHPDKIEVRKIKVGKNIFVPRNDFLKLKGKEIRLMHLYNIKLNTTAQYTSTENKDIPRIQWTSDDNIVTEILMPDGKIIKGLAEANVAKLKVGDIIQFERFGFCKLDKKEKNKITFCFAHN